MRTLMLPVFAVSLVLVLAACSPRGNDHPGFERKNMGGSGSLKFMSGARQHRISPEYRPDQSGNTIRMERKPQTSSGISVLTGSVSVGSSGSIKIQK